MKTPMHVDTVRELVEMDGVNMGINRSNIGSCFSVRGKRYSPII